MIPAKIWSKKESNIETTKEKNIPEDSIANIDVTFADIKLLGEIHALYPIIEFLRASWVGDNKERETNCKIGTMRSCFNEDGAIEMKFTSRTHFPKETQRKILKAFKNYWRSINNS